jgi:hypothetical protein
MARVTARIARRAPPIRLSCIFRRRAASPSRLLAGCCVAFACALGPVNAQEPAAAEQKIPSFAELEAAGAVIGEIRVNNQNIFDLKDPKENGVLYRAANFLHIQTRASVIRRQLLFKPGERVSVRVIEETERLMRSSRILYDVSIAPVAYHDGVVDIDVKTRDTWTLEPGVSASRQGGTNRRGATLRDTNVLGTGVLAGVERSFDADRTTTTYRVTQPRAFDGWTTIDYSLARLSDGESRALSVVRPFYALDTRWAAGFSGGNDSRIDSLYSNGIKVAQFRHRQDNAEAFGGWSEGLVDGWARRYSLGVTYRKDTYGIEPDLPAPDQLPSDNTIAAPFFRYEVVQDGYEKVKNRDLIERPEYFAMGFQSSVQLGRAWTGFGSTQNLWLYSASASDGFRFPSDRTVLTSVSISGQSGYGPLDNQLLSGSIRFYGRPDSRTLLFASVAGDALKDPTLSSQLLLGGDTGLRGYPRNYQSGERRALLNVEERVYTDWYPFRLFRVGGAVFYDYGRAWGGVNGNTANTGWLSDVGFGLRILSARSAFGNVLHIDFAIPLNRDPNIRSVQFIVTTKVTL